MVFVEGVHEGVAAPTQSFLVDDVLVLSLREPEKLELVLELRQLLSEVATVKPLVEVVIVAVVVAILQVLLLFLRTGSSCCCSTLDTSPSQHTLSSNAQKRLNDDVSRTNFFRPGNVRHRLVARMRPWSERTAPTRSSTAVHRDWA